MGTALALLFDKGVAEVKLWSRDPEHAQQFAMTRVNQRHLPGIRITESVRITADGFEAAHDADLIVAAIPTSYLRATLSTLAPELPAGVPVLSVVKGIEDGTFARPSQIIHETMDHALSPCSADRATPKSWRADCLPPWLSQARIKGSTPACAIY